MHIFEAIMLICFGISWPISIAKSLRTKVVVGKSPLFMIILCVGYTSGIINRVIHPAGWVIWLYVMNLILVAFDLFLYYKYLKRNGEERIIGSLD